MITTPTLRAEWLFRAIYPLSAARAVEAGRFALLRYLPSFRAKHPELGWPRELLADVAAWAAGHETGMPDDADHDSADTSFRHGLHALLVAWLHRDDAARRTAAVVIAIRSAWSAFETAVWAADEPAAFTAWATGDLANARRTPADNAAAVAVGEREWLAVVAHLASPDPTTPELDAALARWRRGEHGLL